MLNKRPNIEVVRGSVIDQCTDAIVNAANTSMRGGGGVDGAIHRAAGPGLLEELIRVSPHGAKTGNVVVTGGHNLSQKYIFHTPGPVWDGGGNREQELLANCYQNCLLMADELAINSIAFCSISTGVYGFPLALAAPLAINTTLGYITSRLETNLREVRFVMFGDAEFNAFSSAMKAGLETAIE